MPFKSEAQRQWIGKNRPELAAKFESETPKGVKLPDHVKPKGVARAKIKQARTRYKSRV